jgi:thiazole/oxazole-forming peptide maturase SagD family component
MYRSPLAAEFVGAGVIRGERVIGVAWDIDAAAAKQRAMSEAVERSALERCDHRTAVHTADELGDLALPLSRAVRFSPEQLADRMLARYRWTSRTPTSWIAAARLETPAEQVLVPVDLVFFRGASADATLLRPASSTGTAAYPSRDEAFLRALLECIERHEISAAHRRGSVAARICIDDLSSLRRIGGLLDAASVGLEVGLLPVSFEIPVAIAALTSSRPGRPSIAVGSGCGVRAADAMIAATLEAIQIFHFAWQLMQRGSDVPDIPRNSRERALWWATRPAAFANLLFSGAGAVPLSPTLEGGAAVSLPAEEAKRLVAVLDRHGHAGAMLDITSPCTRQDSLRVLRVILPSLLLPHPDERYPFLMSPCVPGDSKPVVPTPYA